MVCFDQARKMGEAAGSGAVSSFKNTIKYMKRLVGLAFDDPRAKAEMEKVAFECVPMKHSLGGPDSIAVKVIVDGDEKVIPVEAVCGMMIHHMGTIAAKKAAETSGMADTPDLKAFFPQDWVIAIPSYYTDLQRRALLHGCEIVGIPGVQRLMHENTATALAYGIFKDIRKEFEKEKPTNVMFIDIGASQYSVTIASFEPGKLIVKASTFDQDLGGRDFDQTIANWLADSFYEKYQKKLSTSPYKKPKVMLKLLTAAEKAKKTLSPHGVKEAFVNLECLMEDLDFNIKLKAPDYEDMCKPLIDRLEGPILKCLEDAQLGSKDLASVEIVGGSTRIGFIKKRLMKILDAKSLSTTMNADEAIARGAALQSAILSPRFKVLPYEIVDANPLPIMVSWDEAADGVEMNTDGSPQTNSVTMFDRLLNYPIVRRVTLRRNGDFFVKCKYDQSAYEHGLQKGVSPDIVEFNIKAPAGNEKKIRVNVKQDIHGIITLSSAQMVEEIEPEEGEETPEGEEKKKKVKKTNLEYTMARPLDWSKDEIARFNEFEVAMANQDRVVKETADMRNELESYIYDMRDKIISESQLANYGTQAEKDAFDKKQMDTENWLYEDGFDATKSVYAGKLAELKKIGGPIEARAAQADKRPNAVAAIQKNVEKYKNWLADAQGNDMYSHIADEEFEKCHSSCDSTSSWVYDMLDKQGSLAQNVDPAFTAADMQTKSQELTNVCGPIMHKPKPKPLPKVPAAAPAEEKPQEEAPAEAPAEGEGESMDVEESKEDGENKMETEE
jgi:heat shock protein 4